MKWIVRSLLSRWWLMLAFAGVARAESPELAATLERVYGQWRVSLINRDITAWQATTAAHRQMDVRNRLLSERRAFPAELFNVPVGPPPLEGLRRVDLRRNGPTAKATYFGRVDFGVGGEPTDNLYVLSFVQEATGWKYDTADFVSLAALPAERAEIARGDFSYIEETADFHPDGTVPPVPIAVGPAKYIAKVYVFSPGRDVRVQVNKVSHHRVVNDRDAQVVIGGARDGLNEVQWAIRPLDGGTGKEAMTIRVYLMSEIEGVTPVKAFEYQIEEGGVPREFGTGHFNLDAAMAGQVMGR